jgi:hypothetical protein
MISLESLTATEETLAREVSRVTGLIHEKEDQLEAAGVFRRYLDVHTAYTELATAGDLEALKRALFLQWYALSVPCFCTGIFETAPDSDLTVLTTVERLLDQGRLDPELHHMLPYYYFHTDFFLEAKPGLESLKRYCHQTCPAPPSAQWVEPSAMVGRGLMGEYWRSVATAGRKTR